jgi:hypothetical protein
MKKRIALIALAAIALTLLAGCGGDAAPAPIPSDIPAEPSAVPAATPTPEPTPVPTPNPYERFITENNVTLDNADVQFDYSNNAGNYFSFLGTAELADYYNYGYRGSESSMFVMRVKPSEDSRSSTSWYIYADREKFAALFDIVKNDTIGVNFACYVDADHLSSGQKNMATLADADIYTGYQVLRDGKWWYTASNILPADEQDGTAPSTAVQPVSVPVNSQKYYFEGLDIQLSFYGAQSKIYVYDFSWSDDTLPSYYTYYIYFDDDGVVSFSEDTEILIFDVATWSSTPMPVTAGKGYRIQDINGCSISFSNGGLFLSLVFVQASNLENASLQFLLNETPNANLSDIAFTSPPAATGTPTGSVSVTFQTILFPGVDITVTNPQDYYEYGYNSAGEYTYIIRINADSTVKFSSGLSAYYWHLLDTVTFEDEQVYKDFAANTTYAASEVSQATSTTDQHLWTFETSKGRLLFYLNQKGLESDSILGLQAYSKPLTSGMLDSATSGGSSASAAPASVPSKTTTTGTPVELAEAYPVGVWPLAAGTYDPGLDGQNIPRGAEIFGCFDSLTYNSLPVPTSLTGYTEVQSMAEVTNGKYYILAASSGFDYIVIGTGNVGN